jgi:hypothetical protein
MGGTSADRVRAWLDIAIRVLVLLVVLVVMLRPAGFAARLGELRDALRENGFSLALDIPGIGAIEERIEASTEALSELRSLNEEQQTLLGCLAANTCSASQHGRIEELLGAAPAASIGVDRLIAANERVLATTSASRDGTTAGDWAVVAGSDRTFEGAQDEATKLGRFDVEIMRRGDWYATVARFPSELEARGAVPEIAGLVGREPFVRNLSTWCPNPTQTDPDYLICNP